MEAEGSKEEPMLPETGFSISVGNIDIIESSTSMSSRDQQSLYRSKGKTTSQLNTQVKRNKNLGDPIKTRKSNNRSQTVLKTTDLTDDGYGWRKYGQKDINNNPHPKSYYRCTHHMEEKCEAKKWVQKESDDPPVYKTTYLGNHTCQNPLKIPEIITESYDNPYSSSMSKPILLCFDSPNSNHSSNIISNDQHVTHHTGSFTSSLSPSVDSKLFSDEPSSTGICVNMEESIQIMGPDEIETCLPPMASPSSNFGSYDFNRMVEELQDLDSVTNYMD